MSSKQTMWTFGMEKSRLEVRLRGTEFEAESGAETEAEVKGIGPDRPKPQPQKQFLKNFFLRSS